jgi:hypothetical protein
VGKKKVAVPAVSVSSTKVFPTVGLALHLEVPTTMAVSIRGRKVGEECWNCVLDDRLEVVIASIHLEATVTATSKAARLWETLPTTSQVVGLCENPVT